MLLDLSLPVGFGLNYAALAATPGANFLLVTQLSLSAPRKSALMAALGVAIGASTLALLALSSGPALLQFASMFWILNIAYAVLMIHFGITALRAAIGRRSDVRRQLAAGAFQCFRTGAATALLNPLTMAFFLGLAVTSDCKAGECAVLEFSLTIFLVAVAWFGSLALCFSNWHVRRTYRVVQPWLDGGIGIFFIWLGLRTLAP